MTSTIKNLSSPNLQVAAIQLNSQQNIAENLTHIHAAIDAASTQGAKLVVLPENACSMGQQHATAERFDELSNILACYAEQYNLYLLAGTLPCPYRPDGSIITDGRLRQASLLFAPDGLCVARYDKIHLFTATVTDTQGSYNEAATFEAGTQTIVAPMHINEHDYHLGMMVCFDLRFPTLAQRLRQAGADILSAPSAFTYPTGQAHWSLLLRARALDSQCLVIGAAQGGEHHYKSGTSRQTWGHTTITSYDGVCLNSYPDSKLDSQSSQATAQSVVQAMSSSKTQSSTVLNSTTISTANFALVMAELDATGQQQARQKLPIFSCHRLA